jgi:hypothetical protein
MGKSWVSVLGSSAKPVEVPQAEVQSLAALCAQAEKTLELAASSERTPVITAQCREDFGALEEKMRFIKNHHFIELTEVGYAALGLRSPRDRSPVPLPEGFPEADVSYPGVHTLDLHPRPVAGQPHPDKRCNYGYRIYWGVLPPGGASVEAATGEKRELMKAPVSGKELPHSRWTRRQRERFDFDGDSGKTVYFCIRYENSKGEAGEFGPIFQAVIP